MFSTKSRAQAKVSRSDRMGPLTDHHATGPEEGRRLRRGVSREGEVGQGRQSDLQNENAGLLRGGRRVCECAGAAITFPQTGWLEQFPLSQFWRLGVLNQGVGKPVLPLKAPAEDPPHLLQLLVAPGIPWRVAASAFAWPVSSPVLCVSLIRTLVLALRAFSKTEMSSPRDIPNSVTSAKILFPNTDMTAQVPGIPTWTCAFPGGGVGGHRYTPAAGDAPSPRRWRGSRAGGDGGLPASALGG